MPVSDFLKGMRESGFKKPGEEKSDESKDSSPRTIMLSDDEVKSISTPDAKPGEEVTIQVTGRLEEDGHFHIMSVGSDSTMPDQDMKDMAAKVAGVPTIQNQTMPSPS